MFLERPIYLGDARAVEANETMPTTPSSRNERGTDPDAFLQARFITAWDDTHGGEEPQPNPERDTL
jgi:hypothetical protein